MFVAIMLLKTYTHLSKTELKRRIKNGDELAEAIFKVSRFEETFEILLWAIIGLSAAGFFITVSRSLSVWLSIPFVALVIWLGFAWIPYTRISKVNNFFAKLLASPISWLLNHLYPVLRWFADITIRFRAESHTGVFEKEDLAELISRQEKQHDNRIDSNELRVIKGALSFGDKIVRDIMVPRRVARVVSADETVGPHLMDELYSTGHSRFPVYEGAKDKIVGILYLRDIAEVKDGRSVRTIMDKTVRYVHEEEDLNRTLQAFLKSHRHLLVVVNSFEEVVGILTLEDVLEQIIGSPIVDEFDKYDDLRAVAKKEATEVHQEHEKDDKITSDESTEQGSPES